MEEKTRNSCINNSCIDTIGDMPWGTHFCQFYQTKEDLMDVLIPYFKTGLKNNELCIWVISESLNIEETRETLKRTIPDFDAYFEKGQIEIIPYSDWFLNEDVFNPDKAIDVWLSRLDQALKVGYEGLRVTENICSFGKRYWDDLASYEERLDSFINNQKMMVLCSYCLEELSPAQVIDVISNHQISLIKKGKKWEQIENPGKKKITKSRQTKNVLCSSKEQYLPLYKNSFDGILLTNPDGIILSANPQACNLFGMTEEEIIQAGGDGLVAKDNGLVAALKERELTGRVKSKLTFKRKDGSTFVGEVSSSLFTDADGNIKTGIIIRDITVQDQTEETLCQAYEELQTQSEEFQVQTEELREAYETLNESEKRYRLLLDHSTDAIILTDPREGGKILSANPAACRMLGWSEEELIGRGRDVMFDPEDPALSSLLKERSQSGSAKTQLTYRRKDGSTFPGEVSSALFIDNNGEPRAVAIIRDITERKQAEEALNRERSLLESIIKTTDFMLAFFDAQFNFVWANPAYAESCKMKSEDLIGKNHFALYPHAENEEIFRKVRDTGEGVFYKDKPFVYPDQPERGVTYWDWSLAPVKNPDGHVTGLVMSLRERTKYKQAEDALHNAYEKLRIQSEELQASYKELHVQSEKLQETIEALHESETRLQVIIANSPDVIFEQDLNLRYTWIYNPAPPLLVSDIIGKRDADLLPPDQAQQLEAIKHRVIGTGRREQTLLQLSPGGESRWYEAIYEPRYDSAGQITGVLSYTRDVTERKQVDKALEIEHARLRAIIDAMPIAISIVDADGRIIETNEQANLIWGVPSHSDKSITDYNGHKGWWPDTGEKLHAEDWAMSRALAEGEVIVGEEVDIQRFDGSFGTILNNAAPIRDTAGRIIGGVAVEQDITKRKQVEEALQKSEERYRMLFTNMTEAFLLGEVVCDKDGKPYDYRFLEVNPAYESSMGIKKEQVLGRTILEVFPSVNPLAIEKSSKVALSGKPMHFEIFSHVANRYFEVYAFSPEKRKFALIFRDISERKEAEAKLKETLDNLDKLVKERTAELEKAYNSLKESEERYRIVVERTGQLVYDYDLRADKGSWTGAIEEITGYTAEEFQKFDRFVWIDNIHPEDLHRVQKTIREAIKTGKTFQEELRFRRKDGSYIYVEDSGAFLLDEKGIPYRSLGVMKDITERKLSQQKLQQSEEKYRSFIENFKGIAFYLDKDFNLVFIHGAVEEITGYSEEELVFDKWKQVIVPEDLAFLLEGEKKAQSSGDYHGEFDYRIRSKDGSIKWVHDIHQKIPGKNGKAEAYTGIIYDITEKKEAEETLARIDEARIKEIHHRIKNNLQVISSLLSLEAERFNDAKILEAFRESQNRVNSMAIIHEELYRGKGTDNLDFAVYIEKLTKKLFSSYNLRNEDIILKSNLEQTYLGMDTAIPLGIIVNELVSNSLKHAFSDGRKGEVSINLKKNGGSDISKENFEAGDCQDEKDFQYMLTVADNGKGIPAEIDFEDAGSLGLQLVNILADQIDGEIKLKRDQGTKFILWFSNVE